MSTVQLVALEPADVEWLIGYLKPASATPGANPSAARIVARLEGSAGTAGPEPRWARTDLPPLPDPLEDRLFRALNSTALKYMDYATKAQGEANKAAWSVVAAALLDVKVALQTGDGAAPPPAAPAEAPVATGGEPADESATGAPTPEPAPSPLCHEVPFDRASECVLPAHHADALHQDAYGNRWSW